MGVKWPARKLLRAVAPVTVLILTLVPAMAGGADWTEPHHDCRAPESKVTIDHVIGWRAFEFPAGRMWVGGTGTETTYFQIGANVAGFGGGWGSFVTEADDDGRWATVKMPCMSTCDPGANMEL